MLETALAQSLNMGGMPIFFTRPISLGFLIGAVVITLFSIQLRRRVPAKTLTDESDS
jgi:hypothetical protein